MEHAESKDLQEGTALQLLLNPKGHKRSVQKHACYIRKNPRNLTSGILCPLHHMQLIFAKSPLPRALGMWVCLHRYEVSTTKLASAGKISSFEDFFKINTTFAFQETSHCILLQWFPYPQFLCNSAPTCSSRKTNLSFLRKLKLILLVHPVFRAPHHSQSCSDLKLSAGYPMWKNSASKATERSHGNSCFFYSSDSKD